MLSSNHNLGKLSRIFDTLQEAAINTVTSYVIDVWIMKFNGSYYLSSSFKELEPILGNRLSRNENNEIFYLITDNQGKLLNKIRL